VTTGHELRDAGVDAARLLGLDPATVVAIGFRLHASGRTSVEVELLVDSATRGRLADIIGTRQGGDT
jgi:hypothetical protein